jgi:hypothetical protein
MPRVSSTLLAVLLLLFTMPAPGGARAPAPAPGAPDAGDGPASTADEVTESTDRALTVLSRHVRRKSHPDALRLAFQAYFRYAAAQPAQVRNPYFFFVDYGLDNGTPRGWVFDMEALELVEGPFTVAHGSGSSDSRNGVPTRFSNRPGSYMTSLGLFLAQETYRFSGKSGGRRYTSVGLRMRGLSGRFNDAARRRGIVSHGAPYVSRTDAGRSQGCPAMEQARAGRLLPKLADGGIVFLYSPRNAQWLREGPWVATPAVAAR